MSTKATLRAGKNWHLYTEVFEEEKPHVYLEVEGITTGEIVVRQGKASVTIRLSGPLLSLLDPEIRREVANRSILELP